MKKSVISLLGVGIALGVIGSQALNAQQTTPTKGNGVTAKAVASLDLGPEIPELQGRYLRARVITIEPNGYTAVHSHKDRPAIVYVLQGTQSECKPDRTCTEVLEGQAKAEGKDSIELWHANKGTKPLTVLVIDISKER